MTPALVSTDTSPSDPIVGFYIVWAKVHYVLKYISVLVSVVFVIQLFYIQLATSMHIG